MKKEGVLDVLDPDCLCPKNDPDHVESEGIARTLKARDPDLRRTAQLTLLPPVHGADRTAKGIIGPRLHFDESDGAVGIVLRARCDEINIAMAVPEAMLNDVPAVNPEPPRRDTLAFHSHRLSRFGHESQSRALHLSTNIHSRRTTSGIGA